MCGEYYYRNKVVAIGERRVINVGGRLNGDRECHAIDIGIGICLFVC